MFGGAYFAGVLFAGVTGLIGPLPAQDTTPGISLGGADISGRVRISGLVVRDILNDAPNTCTFVMEGDGPALGQKVRVTLGPRLLFAGVVETVDQSYESLPAHVAWHVTAIDDTFAANARRPFGTWVQTSATTIAQAITGTYAPGYNAEGVAAGLPPVSITFDGADPFIACLTRLATMIGGYAKIDDGRVYLFTDETATTAPDPIDATHRFLTNPPITCNRDLSQVRTRVYGKGYGEPVIADLAAGEVLIPVANGANFTQTGGRAIIGTTAEGAQSQQIAYIGVLRPPGGTLVGPGAAPANAPALALATGGVVTNGTHNVGVVFLTATGPSLMGPTAPINVNPLGPPNAALTANPAVNGTGPDLGNHDYVVTNQMLGGETTPGPASNVVTTSDAVGQLPSPFPLGALNLLVGAGVPDGQHDYVATFVNAKGETPASSYSGYWVEAKSILVGQTSPVTPGGVQQFSEGGVTGGNVDSPPAGQVLGDYYYFGTFITASGETTIGSGVQTVVMHTGENASNVRLQTSADGRVTGRKIYRQQVKIPTGGQIDARQSTLLATVNNNTSTGFFDTISQTSIQGNAAPPTTDTTANPGTMQPNNQIQVTGIQTGQAGTTARKLYRRFNLSGPYGLVASIGNNTATTYTDTAPALGAPPPPSNTTGTATQQVPLTAIPLGSPGTSGRRLYRRFNGAGAYRLVTTITNNTATTYTDTTPNSGLGASAPTANTATGNTINLTDIPRGAAAVTSREVYMSLAGTFAMRRALVIPDNTATTGVLNIADAALASNPQPPTSDTSGLPQPQGQVNAGSPTLLVASAAPFLTTGGWVITGGGQVVRYTGITGQTLTGVPASGPGAIVTTILYGQQATPAPTLTGVTGLSVPIQKGSTVAIWVQRDDLLAQAEMAALVGWDGIIEYLIVDSRRGEPSLVERCDADLALFSRPIVTVSYATRDTKTKSGRTVAIHLTQPAITQTLIIQEVTITEIGLAPGLAPRFTVKASSVRFSLEDTLRRLIAGGQTTANN